VNQSSRDILKALAETGTLEGASQRLARDATAIRFLLAGMERTHGQLVETVDGHLRLTALGHEFAYTPAPKLWERVDDADADAGQSQNRG